VIYKAPADLRKVAATPLLPGERVLVRLEGPNLREQLEAFLRVGQVEGD
jgi:hypothetical protein